LLIIYSPEALNISRTLMRRRNMQKNNKPFRFKWKTFCNI